MVENTPLLLIAASIVGFWLIGKILTRSYRRFQRQQVSRVSGTKVIEHFHISGIDSVKIEKLVELIRAKDETQIASFIAKERPKLEEIEDYLKRLREQFHNSFPVGFEFASDIDKAQAISKMHLVDQPKLFKFDTLSQQELRCLVEYDSGGKRHLNHDFFEKFGEENFMENFRVFTQLSGELPTTMHIEKDHKFRTQLEALAKSSMVLRGRKIHLRDRLNVLDFKQLKDMAKELKIEGEYESRQHAADQLAEIPGSAVLLAMIYPVDDIFLIKSDPYDTHAVENEWSVMSNYSKLLCNSLGEQDLAVIIL